MDSTQEEPARSPPTFKPGPRFWAILVALSFISLLTSLEATVTSTVLPSIVADLGGGDNYIWVSNAYFLSMTALLPMFGQLANVFGRRWPLITSGVLFMAGSAVCGRATSMTALIAGRAVQGIGGAGIGVLCEIVVCDLVPLRQRGTYMGAVLSMVGLGAALGPLFGGLLVRHSTWRWAFYMALPTGGVAVALLVAVLHVQYDRSQTVATKLASLDWLGSVLFVGGTVPILLALGWAGGADPWSSYRVLVPLLVGLATLGAFLALEGQTRLAPHPMVPLRLFRLRTTAIVFLLTFAHGLVTMWALYFLPVYFQGVLALDAYRAGMALLPTILALLPGAILGGLLLSRFGRYKPILAVCFALVAVGFGLFSLLDAASSTAAWVGFQVLESFGAGVGMAALLPALLAPLTDKDTALATATWGVMRSFGILWGVAIAGAIYTSRAAQLAAAIVTDQTVASVFQSGGAYGAADVRFLDTLSPETRAQVISVQSAALQRSWQVAIAFGGLGLLATAAMKHVPLREQNDTDFGMVETKEERVSKDVEQADGVRGRSNGGC
ncbi:Major Facilitator Superfamily protein [Sporothrix schenckii 1099-18]|uniref:Major facilitator superfamily (MFS) profile domain-containing protein n=2 Tax=Sporothrix schenckii TaxID=29908 RepID=U7Q2Y6_SPOS1|nr:Major Facilitator Superfamily protein [Sporothrix schenckii 1099-18]ERT01066.1 hypothetical protein HMPREF1624_02303 [Sporothrix schenckii ATCC 58251]KJR88198.1 Major Facilitator Superfamily protein [Sporothrix schenckii 1099-18]